MSSAGTSPARLLAVVSTAQLARTRSIVGAWAKISILQYFVAEATVIAAWAGPQPYSRRFNVISDLGAEHCGTYSGRNVCSPLHLLMDASFIAQGLAMIVGALLLSTVLFRVAGKPGLPPAPQHPGWAVAIRVLIILSGLGTVVVGLVPEDVIFGLHYAGAVTYFVPGGLSLVALWWSWRRRRIVSGFLLLCGVVSLVSTVVFGLVPGIERGTVERLMAYPITIGLSTVGVVVGLGCRRARAVLRKQTAGRQAV
ncbi:DUF998 domain-containing protein [Arthrobacter sp. A5]|uniref:DUF998 domain-containing protein n=1 Tax=Arthrobacter sp. A5 TaxID=576926 RepID=UPI003DA887D9